MRPRRLLPHLTLAFVALAIAGLCIWVVYQGRLPRTAMAQKLASAQRLSYHVITPTQGPRFELYGSERRIKIVSHPVLDPSLDYDPRRTINYGLRLELHHANRLLWHHEVNLETRQSKLDWSDGLWMHENAFTSRLDLELGDDRMVIVHLPEDFPPGSQLAVRLLGDPERGLVRVYQRVPREESARENVLKRLDESGGNALVDHNSYEPWTLLDVDEKLDRLHHTYQRLAPVGEPGFDFTSLSVFYTGFRTAVEELEGDRGLLLERQQGLVVNVLGPTSVRVELRRGARDSDRVDENLAAEGSDSAASDASAAVVRVRAVSEYARAPGQQSGTRPAAMRWELPVPGTTRPSFHELSLPTGLHSLHFFTDARTPVRLDISGPPLSQFGTMPYLDYDEHDRRLLPDERRLAVFETGPGQLPVEGGFFAPDDPRAQIVRIDVRTLLTSTPRGVADEPPLANAHFETGLAIEFLDGQGKVMSAEQQVVRAPYTPFERIERTDDSVVSVTEPVGLRLIAPPSTHSVRVSASRDVALRLYRFLEGEDVFQAPYDLALSDTLWRYAPRDRRQWFHTTPSNAPALLEAEQRALLVAQVRLIPHGSGSGDGEGDGDGGRDGRPPPSYALKPIGRPAQHEIHEPVPPRRFVELMRRWPPGMSTKIPAARTMRLRSDGRARPRLDYLVPTAALGDEVTVRVDGDVVDTRRFTTTRGHWRLPRLSRGDHAFTIETSARSATFLIDQPPAPAAAGGPARFSLVRRRTVYALGTQPLEVEVRKPAGQSVRVTMVVYAPWTEDRDDISVHAIIGGGVPKRVPRTPFARITVAERSETLPASEATAPATFADREHPLVGYPRFISVPLGDDLLPGNHRVGFSLRNSQPLWARFYVTHVAPQPSEEALQWRFAAEMGDPLGATPEPSAPATAAPADDAIAPRP
ncbi:hypothetical protein [Haliangium ochraceum]|uniref:Uncharacterized protein n=1 Tax=Haliangium ochraceum (strain DSM 14365 / JCM 11303 / SMP-2) TaxID=502025 RepID=D0LFP4_HALO1|nr:hypothetical protein [Haliangium ochraceum]ACY12678.1 hypothetical protein Hoch_0036 [Haliangium ochraceum DSM 14365]